MKKNIKTLLILLFAIFLIGCSSKDNSLTPTPYEKPKMENEATSKESYLSYLNDRANHYLSGLTIDTEYNLDNMETMISTSGEDFLNGFKGSYRDLESALIGLKNDLETNVKAGVSEVDELNGKVLTSINKTLDEINVLNSNLETKRTELTSKANDEFMSGLKDISSSAHSAKTELNKLLQDAKNSLGL